MESRVASEPSEAPIDHLSITLVGPLSEEHLLAAQKTSEQRLADAKTVEERICTLGPAAKSRFEAGQFEEARRYVSELERMLAEHGDLDRYPDAVANAHIVFGRLALKDGDVTEAKRRLAEAGKSDGSAVMSSFGPDMSLARDLLLAGEKQAVLDYFQACARFWHMGTDRLDEWTMYVNAGRIPRF